jgi:hypothetical protein
VDENFLRGYQLIAPSPPIHAVAAEADAQQSPHGPVKDSVAVVEDNDGADQPQPTLTVAWRWQRNATGRRLALLGWLTRSGFLWRRTCVPTASAWGCRKKVARSCVSSFAGHSTIPTVLRILPRRYPPIAHLRRSSRSSFVQTPLGIFQTVSLGIWVNRGNLPSSRRRLAQAL